MLISAFFPKLMEKLKHGSMLLRTEESVRFRFRGKNKGMEKLLSWISINVDRSWRWEKSACTGARTSAPFPSFQKGSPSFQRWRAGGLGSQASGKMPARHGTPSFYRFHPLLSPHPRYIHCSYRVYKDRGEGKERDNFAFHRRQSSCSVLYIYI